MIDSPRAAFEGGLQDLALTATPAVVRSVSLVVPVAGTVIVNAHAAGVTTSDGVDSGQCSLTTQTGLDFNFRTVFRDVATAAGNLAFPVAMTRGFAVAPGSFTVNFVCRMVSGTSSFQDSSITAMFFPTP